MKIFQLARKYQQHQTFKKIRRIEKKKQGLPLETEDL